MELWYTEKQTPDVGITCKITKTLHSEESPYQKIDIIDTLQFGRMLILDGMVMTTVKDEFIYHEMISHIALNTHPNPQKVLVVGGGDGGAIREIIKHQGVEEAVLCEIDERVIELSKKYLPEIAGALDDSKVEVLAADGIKHIKDKTGYYDIIIVDSTEPIGPAEGLFALEFYQEVHKALRDDGIMVAQTESPYYNGDLISRVYKDISSVFPITRLYYGCIPTYPSGMWTWTIGSKKYDPLMVDEDSIPVYQTKYYTPYLHKAVFQLPQFVKDLLI